jgi:hypothetical protein
MGFVVTHFELNPMEGERSPRKIKIDLEHFFYPAPTATLFYKHSVKGSIAVC